MLTFSGESNRFFGSLHPASLMIYLTLVMVWAIVAAHPLVLMLLLGVVLVGLTVAARGLIWARGSVGLLFFAFPVIIINILINDMGDTVLWAGPFLGPLGQINVTLENVAFSLTMLVRLAVTLFAFMLFNLVMDVDRALRAMTRVFPRSGLLVILTAKSMPQLITDVKRIAEVQRCRGIDYENGSWLERFKKRLPLLKVLVTSALEGSFTLAESMQARAYGSGRRTHFHQERLRGNDAVLLLVSGLTLLGLALGWGRGYFSFHFYPALGELLPQGAQLIYFLVMGMLVSLPIVVAWGWEKWRSLHWTG